MSDRWAKVPWQVAADQDLSASDLRILIMVYSRAGVDGCWASIGTMATDLQMHRRTARRSIKKLVEKGWLTEGGTMKNKHGDTTIYHPSTPQTEPPVKRSTNPRSNDPTPGETIHQPPVSLSATPGETIHQPPVRPPPKQTRNRQGTVEGEQSAGARPATIIDRVNAAVDESPHRRQLRMRLDAIIDRYNEAVRSRADMVRQAATREARDPEAVEPPLSPADYAEAMSRQDVERLISVMDRVGDETWQEGLDNLARLSPRARQVWGIDGIMDLCRLSAEDRKIIAAGRSGEDRGPYIVRLARGEIKTREGESKWRTR